jgi:hypothetical protein
LAPLERIKRRRHVNPEDGVIKDRIADGGARSHARG